MAEWQVIWTETADSQLQSTLEYWLIRTASKRYPEQILKLVDEYIGYISERPNSFRKTEHNNNRVCVLGTYSIFFKTKGTNIYVTCFWDNRQDPKRLKRILRRKNGT